MISIGKNFKPKDFSYDSSDNRNQGVIVDTKHDSNNKVKDKIKL